MFVCPVSCARIICLNAIKNGYKDRIDVLALTEDDIVSGSYEEKTVDAAIEVLEGLEIKPKAFIIYVSCIDAMLGNDHSFQTQQIMDIFPDVNCFVLKMCPITRYSGDLPLVALQHDMYAALPEDQVSTEKTVAFIGSNIALDPDNELVQIIKNGGYRPLHIQACDRYEDYLAVRSSALNLCLMPFGKSACELLNRRYGTPMLPYFAGYDLNSIRNTITQVCNTLDIPMPDIDAMETETLAVLRNCAEEIGDTELVVDSTATLFPDQLRKLLTDCGFKVRRVYADDVNRTVPDVDSGNINIPVKRSYGAKENVIAIGMVSSSLEGALKTVDMFYDNGEWGYYGIRKLAERIKKAAASPMSVADIRKGNER